MLYEMTPKQVESFLNKCLLDFYWDDHRGIARRVFVEDKFSFCPATGEFIDLNTKETVKSVQVFQQRCEELMEARN